MNFLTHFLYWLKARKYPSGLLKLKQDLRDLRFRDFFAETEYQPPQISRLLGPLFVENQWGLSNCSFQAWAAVLGGYFGKQVSARWLTAKAFKEGLCKKEGWADLRVGAKVAQKWGVVFEADCPSDETLPWEDYSRLNWGHFEPLAAQNKIGSYYRIDDINDYLQAIDKGYCVALGRDWLSSMNQGGGFSFPWIIRRTGLSVGGHATAGVGYHLAYAGERCDIELNSYGKGWGSEGLFYCPLTDLYGDIQKYGAYAISPVPYTPKEELIKSLNEQVKGFALKVIALLTEQITNLKKKT